MEQTDWIAEQENIKLSKEIESALIKLTQNNIVLMGRKMGGNISFNEHLTIQRTIQSAKACIALENPIITGNGKIDPSTRTLDDYYKDAT